MEFEEVYQEVEEYGSLLKKYFEEALNPEERHQLAAWLKADRRNRDLFMRLRNGKGVKTRFERRQLVDVEQDFYELEQRLQLLVRKDRKRFTITWMRYAASVACLLLVGGILWYRLSSSGTQEKLPLLSQGKVSAILTMADGRAVRIGKDAETKGLDDHYAFTLRDSAGELVYQKNKVASEEVRYHQLDVPRGGEYKLVLEDGTVVWLNAASSVRFPEAFSDTLREIEVSGEVFLTVTKDASRPFIVRAGEYRTQVLGTSFMLRAYPDEQLRSTTLVEGKVRVDYRRSSLLLAPGRRAYLDGEVLKEEEADLRYELAWMKGVFLFKHDRLENVMRTLSRWYDVDFLFEDEALKEYEFTGSVYRDQSLDEVLTLFEKMSVVTFVKGEKQIVIKK